jgi:hypothetical protein
MYFGFKIFIAVIPICIRVLITAAIVDLPNPNYTLKDSDG